ncbi:hypothetical protein BS78_01G173100 [Paspalum vaginatum]|nr:hypothetical protein BS78_01G173100 [Paspalum vaginatum]
MSTGARGRAHAATGRRGTLRTQSRPPSRPSRSGLKPTGVARARPARLGLEEVGAAGPRHARAKEPTQRAGAEKIPQRRSGARERAEEVPQRRGGSKGRACGRGLAPGGR